MSSIDIVALTIRVSVMMPKQGASVLMVVQRVTKRKVDTGKLVFKPTLKIGLLFSSLITG